MTWLRRTSPVEARPAKQPPTTQVVLAIAALTIAAYAAVAWNDFISFDDTEYITDNPNVLQGLTIDNIEWVFGFHAGNWHPLTWLSHMLDVQLFGTWAGGHHLVNLTLHLASALLLFAFLKASTKSLWASAFVAAMFALHPLRVESVAWASERKDTLSTFFWLLTMLAYWKYSKSPSVVGYFTVAFVFALGLMAKPMLVTLPFTLLLLDYWPLDRLCVARAARPCSSSEFSGGWFKRLLVLIAEKLPLLAMSAGAAALTLRAQQDAMVSVTTVDVATRVMNAVLSYWRYIWKMFWPVNLGVYYPYPQTPIQYQAALGLAALIVITAIILYLSNRHKYLAVGWFWYLGTLIPVIGLVQVASQSHADRYTYVPLTGLFIIFAWAARDITSWKPPLKIPITVIALALAAASSFLTYRQVGFWKDTLTLFTRTIEVTENNGYIRLALGKMYCNRGEYDKAESQLLESLKTMPDAETFYFLGTVMRKTGRPEEAVKYFGQSLILEPKLLEANYNTGVLLQDMGRHKEAEVYFRKTISLDPSWPEAHSGLALALAAQGNLDEAFTASQQAVRLDPNLPAALRVLGSILARKGDHKAAADEYRKSLEIESDYSAWSNLAESLLHLGDFIEAEKAAMQAIALEPENADAYRNLALAVNALGRRDEALAAAKHALNLEPNNPDIAVLYNQLAGEK